MNALRRAGPAIAVALVFALTLATAWAFWTAGSVPGGNGAAAAATLNPGATPTATVSADTVTVAWAASTVSTGAAAGGYLVRRYDATTHIPQTILTSCTGTVTATSCTENTVPTGLWVYTVTPVLGDNWLGAESPNSNSVATDSTPPVNAVTVSVSAGNALYNNGTIYYRGVASGSFTLSNRVSDDHSGPASSTTSALAADASGWTHAPSTVAVPSGGPYVSNSFSWNAGTSGTPTELVTGRDVAGNTAVTTLSLVDDSSAPSGTTITYPDGYQPDPSVVVSFASGTDARSGIATRQLQRSTAVLAAGTCGSFGTFANLGPDGPTSPYTDTTVSNSSCARYRYLVTDGVGNQALATSANIAKVLSAPGLYSVLAGTAVVNTGATTVSGDLGVSPSTAITGFPPGIVSGNIHPGDAAAAEGQSQLALAYGDVASRTPTGAVVGDLGDTTLDAGIYAAGAAIAITGTLTLDGQNDPNAVFIFQVDAALNGAAGSIVNLVNGAKASHVIWQVNGAVVIGAGSDFAGTIMASGAITLGDSSLLVGQALSFTAVTMAADTIRFTTTLPPAMSIDGGPTVLTKDTTPTFTGATGAGVGRTVTVTVAGQVLTTTVQSGGMWSVTATELTPGPHPVLATVWDSEGNAGTATQAATIEVNPAPVALGSAATYSVLAGTGVVNTGPTTVSGDLGVSPSTSITGFPPGTVGGTTDAGDDAAAQAQSDLVAAYDDADARTPHGEIAGDLGGQTFHEGIFHQSTAMALTGTVTLDGQDDPNAIFIFQGDAALNTAAGSTVALINGAQAANVFWQIAGAVNTGASASFVGTIMSAGAVTLGVGTRLIGAALSYGTITLAADTVRFTIAPVPTMTITGGATAVTKDTTPAIAGTTDAAAGRTVTVTVSGQVLTTTARSDGGWSVTAGALTAGVHTVHASVRDPLGNTGVATQDLTVEVNPDPVVLGSALTYSVLAATGVVNTGVSTLSGDLGVSPGNSVVGSPTVGGTTHAGDSTAAQAQTDFRTAYAEVAGRTPHATFTGDLNGRTFHAGIYRTTAALTLTGTVTLDGENNSDAVFIFQIGAAATTAAASQVLLVNGAKASNVFWQVAGAVDTGGLSTFCGVILADGAITLGDGTQLSGQVLSTDTVTMASVAITT